MFQKFIWKEVLFGEENTQTVQLWLCISFQKKTLDRQPSRKKLHYNPVEPKIKSFHEKISENLIFHVLSGNTRKKENYSTKKTVLPLPLSGKRYADKPIDRQLLFWSNTLTPPHPGHD